MCVSPICVVNKRGQRQSVPCGKCLECLQDKQQSWCFRLDIEKKYANVSFFVTFTYDDDHLTYADDEACLCKRDFQLYLKQLRKRLEPRSLKYYCVGEYGDKYRPLTPKGRPHYHALMFYRGAMDTFKLKVLIKDLWTSGIAQVLPVQGAQGYVTKYILKFDKRDHIVKPFSLISRGLGIDYLTKSVVSYHHKTLVPYALKPGGYRIGLPRYYKDKLFSREEKNVMKFRADLYRRKQFDLELDHIEFLENVGINYFQESIGQYKNRLYQSLKLYRQKKKL